MLPQGAIDPSTTEHPTRVEVTHDRDQRRPHAAHRSQPAGHRVREQGTTTTIPLGGECDLAGQHASHQAIRSALARFPKCVVLDFSQLTFIDSTAYTL